MSGKTVLYVEDSRVVAETTKRMLERHDLSVVHVLKAEDALRLNTVLLSESQKKAYLEKKDLDYALAVGFFLRFREEHEIGRAHV